MLLTMAMYALLQTAVHPEIILPKRPVVVKILAVKKKRRIK